MENRTEKPTPQRIREAREHGQVARSRDLSSAVAMLAFLGVLSAGGGTIVATLLRYFRGMTEQAGWLQVEPSAAIAVSLQILGVCLVPMCAACLAIGAAVSWLQTGALWAPKAVRWDWERLSLGKGVERLFTAEHLPTLAVGCLKAASVLAIVLHQLAATMTDWAQLSRFEAWPTIRIAWELFFTLAVKLALCSASFGLIDWMLARRRLLHTLRMSRDEIKREHREREGDPRLKAERRRAHRALALAGPIARATCIVVNPTHIAVALAHEPGSDDAPIVLAKGEGLAASRIRALAQRHDIPIVTQVSLARALHRLAAVGEAIPESLFDAAAVVLAHLYREKAMP